ncbi:conjugal transfer protein TraI [Algoriphagus namhaensis]
MKKLYLSMLRRLALLLVFFGLSVPTYAAIPIAEIIRQGVKKVIVAVDLKIQRLQNETIWLQQVQQKMENILSENQLAEIASWGQRQEELYGDYYEGLWKVKEAIAQVQRIKSIARTKSELLSAYQQSWQMLQADGRFTLDELELIHNRYGEILRSSASNLGELTALLKEFSFQVSDGERLERIHTLDQKMTWNFRNLVSLNLQLETINTQRKIWEREGKVLEGLFQ